MQLANIGPCARSAQLPDDAVERRRHTLVSSNLIRLLRRVPERHERPPLSGSVGSGIGAAPLRGRTRYMDGRPVDSRPDDARHPRRWLPPSDGAGAILRLPFYGVAKLRGVSRIDVSHAPAYWSGCSGKKRTIQQGRLPRCIDISRACARNVRITADAPQHRRAHMRDGTGNCGMPAASE